MSFFKLPLPKRAHSLFYHKPSLQPIINISKKMPKLEQTTNNNINNSKDNQKCNIKSCCSTKTFHGESYIDNDIPSVVYLSSNTNIYHGEFTIGQLSPLPDAKDPKFKYVFKEKVDLCTVIFDFSKSDIQINAKKEKLNALIEINGLLSKKAKLSKSDADLLFRMIDQNIFEQDPFLSTKKLLPTTVKSSFVENSWDHLSIVYKILNNFVLIHPEIFDMTLIQKAVYLLNNPDCNVRDNIAIFLKNYTKVHTEHFDEIWKKMKNVLTDVRFDIYSPYCVDPVVSYIMILLNSNIISNSIEYAIQIFESHLLPLFFHKNLPLFFDNLTNLILRIVDDRPNDQLKAIEYLIKHFPYFCSKKQTLFINALSSIFKSMKENDLSGIAQRFFVFISMTIKSPNSKLSESVLKLLQKNHIRPIILSNYELVTIIVFPSLKWASSNHWDKSIQMQSQNVLINLMNMKFELIHNIAVNDLLHQSKLIVDSSETSIAKLNSHKNGQELAKTWAILSRTASRKDKSINLSQTLHKIQIEFLKNEQ